MESAIDDSCVCYTSLRIRGNNSRTVYTAYAVMQKKRNDCTMGPTAAIDKGTLLNFSFLSRFFRALAFNDFDD